MVIVVLYHIKKGNYMPLEVNLYDVLKRMRSLTDLGIPFSFEFIAFNTKSGASDGVKQVTNAQLRKGYRDDQSDKADILIGYVNAHGQNRWFYLPLLLTFNGFKVKP